MRKETEFLAWLPKYGQHLTSLHLGRCDQLLQHLPCPDLLELKLWGCMRVQLGPAADGSPGVIHGCTKLTRLDLASSSVIDGSEGAVVDSLSCLVHLQHLNSYMGGYPISPDLTALSDATLHA
jgi:hypothetical protein